MRQTFLGAAQEVTGSMQLFELDQGSILIDCGFFQGRREESRRRNRGLPREAIAADVAILTHSHIDHSGNLPTLVKSGFGRSIYATPATRGTATRRFFLVHGEPDQQEPLRAALAAKELRVEIAVRGKTVDRE